MPSYFRSTRSGRKNAEAETFYVSFSDLMLLLCVFFVMLLGASKVQEGSFDELRAGFTGDQTSSMGTLEKSLKKAIENNQNFSVSRDKRGVRLDMDSIALFDTGSAVLKSETLGSLVGALRTVANSGYKIDVEGHTDDTPLFKIEKTEFGQEVETNWSLSGRRASAVALVLKKIGVQDQLLRVIGYADTQPKESISGKSGVSLSNARQKNRRVSLLLHERATQKAGGSN